MKAAPSRGCGGVDRGALRACKRFIKLLMDLLSQLFMRRYLSAVVDERALLVRARAALFVAHPSGTLFGEESSRSSLTSSRSTRRSRSTTAVTVVYGVWGNASCSMSEIHKAQQLPSLVLGPLLWVFYGDQTLAFPFTAHEAHHDVLDGTYTKVTVNQNELQNDQGSSAGGRAIADRWPISRPDR